MAGFNISSLFGSTSSGGSLFSSFNFSDYNSIRSGAYKKLMKKYYSQQNDTTKKTTDKTTTKKSNYIPTTDQTLTKVKKESDELKTAAQKLGKDDLWKQQNGAYDTDKIVSAVKSFASEYNDVVAQSAASTNKSVSQQTSYMTSLTKTMSNNLKKAGITVGVDGKMSVDEEALKKADMDSIKSLFSGKYSYASQVADKASAITSAAARNSSMYSGSGAYSGVASSLYNFWA